MIIDKKNQIEQLTSDIITSTEREHYIILKNNNGLLYITDKEDMKNCINKGNYKYLGSIKKDNSDDIESIRSKVINIIQ